MSSWILDVPAQNCYDNGTLISPTVRGWNFVGADIAYNTATGRVDIYTGGAGTDWKESARLATAAALPAYTFSGAANTITANGVGAMPVVDGFAVAVGDVLLLESSGTTSDVHNGLWDVTSIGSAGTKWALERNGLSDETGEITPGLTVYIEEGTAWGGRMQTCTNTGAIVVNTTPITFAATSGLSLVTAAVAGTVNALGAANTFLQTDGATAGGGWVVSPVLADGASLTYVSADRRRDGRRRLGS
jgi:hypothetical protein